MTPFDRPKFRRAHGVAQLLDQVARRAHEKRSHDDLHAAQWSALRYFARAGRRSANVMGLSKYLGNTSGSTSRTAKSLVDRELLEVTPSPDDARSVVFSLTELGHAMLANDPINDVAEILAPLEPEDLSRLGQTLEVIATRLGQRNSSDDD